MKLHHLLTPLAMPFLLLACLVVCLMAGRGGERTAQHGNPWIEAGPKPPSQERIVFIRGGTPKVPVNIPVRVR